MDFASVAALQGVTPMSMIPHPLTLGHTGTVPVTVPYSVPVGIPNPHHITFPFAGYTSRKRTLVSTHDHLFLSLSLSLLRSRTVASIQHACFVVLRVQYM